MVANKHGLELAHHIAQMPYDERKLWSVAGAWNAVSSGVKHIGGHVAGVATAAVNHVKKHAVSLYQKAQSAALYVAPVISATINDVKKNMAKAKHILDSTVNKIATELKKVPSAVTKGIDKALKKTMSDLKYTAESVSKAVKKAGTKVQAAASDYVKDIAAKAKKLGGLVVSVGKKIYQVTMAALNAAKKFVKDKLLPWLTDNLKPIWESAKKKAMKLLKSQSGIDTSKSFNLKFDMSKFSASVVAEGMKNVGIETAKDSLTQFMKEIPTQVPWLTSAIGVAAVVNAPVCIGTISITVVSAGIGGASIAGCAMGIVSTMSPTVYQKITAMGLKIALLQAPKLLGRLAKEFCPKMLSGNGSVKICQTLTKVADTVSSIDLHNPLASVKGMVNSNGAVKFAKKLTGKRRRAQQVSSKRRRLSVLTASHG